MSDEVDINVQIDESGNLADGLNAAANTAQELLDRINAIPDACARAAAAEEAMGSTGLTLPSLPAATVAQPTLPGMPTVQPPDSTAMQQPPGMGPQSPGGQPPLPDFTAALHDATAALRTFAAQLGQGAGAGGGAPATGPVDPNADPNAADDGSGGGSGGGGMRMPGLRKIRMIAHLIRSGMESAAAEMNLQGGDVNTSDLTTGELAQKMNEHVPLLGTLTKAYDDMSNAASGYTDNMRASAKAMNEGMFNTANDAKAFGQQAGLDQQQASFEAKAAGLATPVDQVAGPASGDVNWDRETANAARQNQILQRQAAAQTAKDQGDAKTLSAMESEQQLLDQKGFVDPGAFTADWHAKQLDASNKANAAFQNSVPGAAFDLSHKVTDKLGLTTPGPGQVGGDLHAGTFDPSLFPNRPGLPGMPMPVGLDGRPLPQGAFPGALPPAPAAATIPIDQRMDQLKQTVRDTQGATDMAGAQANQQAQQELSTLQDQKARSLAEEQKLTSDRLAGEQASAAAQKQLDQVKQQQLNLNADLAKQNLQDVTKTITSMDQMQEGDKAMAAQTADKIAAGATSQDLSDEELALARQTGGAKFLAANDRAANQNDPYEAAVQQAYEQTDTLEGARDKYTEAAAAAGKQANADAADAANNVTENIIPLIKSLKELSEAVKTLDKEAHDTKEAIKQRGQL